jgi:hypothetical protein
MDDLIIFSMIADPDPLDVAASANADCAQTVAETDGSMVFARNHLLEMKFGGQGDSFEMPWLC